MAAINSIKSELAYHMILIQSAVVEQYKHAENLGESSMKRSDGLRLWKEQANTEDFHSENKQSCFWGPP